MPAKDDGERNMETEEYGALEVKTETSRKEWGTGWNITETQQ